MYFLPLSEYKIISLQKIKTKEKKTRKKKNKKLKKIILFYFFFQKSSSFVWGAKLASKTKKKQKTKI